jgi:hypothetical protein
VQHLVRVTAERQQTLRRLKDLRRIVVDDLRRDHLVDDQMQARVHRGPAHAQLCEILFDGLVEVGMRKADQRGALVRVMGVQQLGMPVLFGRSAAGALVQRRKRDREGSGGVTRRP